jgi:hypothetical protein
VCMAVVHSLARSQRRSTRGVSVGVRPVWTETFLRHAWPGPEIQAGSTSLPRPPRGSARRLGARLALASCDPPAQTRAVIEAPCVVNSGHGASITQPARPPAGTGRHPSAPSHAPQPPSTAIAGDGERPLPPRPLRCSRAFPHYVHGFSQATVSASPTHRSRRPRLACLSTARLPGCLPRGCSSPPSSTRTSYARHPRRTGRRRSSPASMMTAAEHASHTHDAPTSLDIVPAKAQTTAAVGCLDSHSCALLTCFFAKLIRSCSRVRPYEHQQPAPTVSVLSRQTEALRRNRCR